MGYKKKISKTFKSIIYQLKLNLKKLNFNYKHTNC